MNVWLKDTTEHAVRIHFVIGKIANKFAFFAKNGWPNTNGAHKSYLNWKKNTVFWYRTNDMFSIIALRNCAPQFCIITYYLSLHIHKTAASCVLLPKIIQALMPMTEYPCAFSFNTFSVPYILRLDTKYLAFPLEVKTFV